MEDIFGHRSTAAPRSHVLIQERVRSEQARETYESYARQTARLGHAASWQARSERRVARAAARRGGEAQREAVRRGGEARRERLRELYARDERNVAAALQELELTPDDRKQRMLERAAALRQKRERERQLLVQEKYEQQFKENCDDFRQLDSQVLTENCTAEVREQLREKAQLRADEQKREEYYTQLWEEDRQRKMERERHEREQRKASTRETMLMIEEQVQELAAKRAMEQQEIEAEAEELRRLWHEDNERQKRREQLDAERRQRTWSALNQYNARRRAQREALAAKERDEDLARLRRIISQEEEATRWEEEKRLYARQEAIHYHDQLRIMMQREAENEAELDKLRQQDQDRWWEAREEKWRREEDARRALLQDVLRSREQQIARKREELQRQKEEALEEGQQLQREMQQQKVEEERRVEEARRKKLAHEEALRRQVAHKAQRRREEERDRELELQLSQRAEHEYQSRVNAELARSRQVPTRYNKRSFNWYD